MYGQLGGTANFKFAKEEVRDRMLELRPKYAKNP
jgi:hypothetical protein